DTDYKAIAYTKFIPYTIKALQELNLKVEGIASLDLEDENSVGSLVKRLLGREGNGLEKICINGTCVDETQLTQLIEMLNNPTVCSGSSDKGEGESNTNGEGSDTTAPVITIGEDPVNLYLGDSPYTKTDAMVGVIAKDDVDGDITGDIVIVNPVDTSTLGTYTVTYNVSDEAGNDAEEVTRTVNVIEETINDDIIKSNDDE
ncbi:MAG: DUF5011 domain-containing protein, partial [Patescibacteria group bacterium]|nr:DUF5011 domain-containing protein [Patescibacteria group bacterium]